MAFSYIAFLVSPIKRQESWYIRNDDCKIATELMDCPSCRGSGLAEQSDNELVSPGYIYKILIQNNY